MRPILQRGKPHLFMRRKLWACVSYAGYPMCDRWIEGLGFDWQEAYADWRKQKGGA